MDLMAALGRRRVDVEAAGQTWESAPAKSSADASHLAGLNFDAPSAQEWLQRLEQTPEEDMLAEALAEGLAEKRQALPPHVLPGVTPKDAARLGELSTALAALQRQFAAERAGLGEAREELARREAELRAREAELEEERERQRRCEEARRDYPQPKWLENIEGTVNIGVVGNAGVGKSLLINKLRRIRPQAQGWAPVGVNETTRVPTMYPFPGQPEVRLWDLPGSGTALVPSETYIQDMGLRYFDKVLIVTAGRFTSTEVKLRAELERHGVPFFMVRTKVDIDVWNNKEDNKMEEEATLAQIRDDFKSSHGVTAAYLVSSRDVEAYDMPKLVADLFPGLKRQLDAAAPAFCPSAQGWSEPWVLPPTFSPVLTALQGRWCDNYQAVYLVQGTQVHVTLQQGQRALVLLTESGGCVWWCNRWFVSEENVAKARRTRELRWSPSAGGDAALVWWWSD